MAEETRLPWTDEDWLGKYWSDFTTILPSSTPLNASHKAIAAQFVNIILKHSNDECVGALSKYFDKLTYDRPQDVGAYCRILKAINDTPTIKKLEVPEDAHVTSFYGSLLRSLNEDINDGLEDVYSKSNRGLGNLDIAPDNIRLTTSLFGASTIAVGLQKLAHVPSSLIRIGIGEPSEASDPEKKEIMAIVACIYLAVAGSKIRDEGSLPDFKGGVSPALKALKKDNIIKSASGIALLQRTIENADSGFTQDIAGTEAWNILFPSTE